MPRVHPFLLPALALGLAAAFPGCAAQGAPPVERRVMVKLAGPGSDAAAIAQRAGRVSGVPVRYAAAMGAQWHGLVLHCGDEARCDEAVRRLLADGGFFLAVERDEHHRPQAPS